MEFQAVVARRRMVRHFSAEPVGHDVPERIALTAERAPSAGFSQGQRLVVVTRPVIKRRVAALCGEEGYVEAGFHPWLSEAPALFVPCVSEQVYHDRYREPDKLRDDGTEIEWPDQRSPSLRRGWRTREEFLRWERWDGEPRTPMPDRPSSPTDQDRG